MDNSTPQTTTTPAALPPSGPRSAEVVIQDLNNAAAAAGEYREAGPVTRARVFLTLRAACGSVDRLHRFILVVYGRPTVRALASREMWALHGWLKPIRAGMPPNWAPCLEAMRDAATVLAPLIMPGDPPAAGAPIDSK